MHKEESMLNVNIGDLAILEKTKKFIEPNVDSTNTKLVLCTW